MDRRTRLAHQLEAVVDDEFPPFARLIVAVIQTAVSDALKGDPGAVNWFGSRWFDYYCSAIDIEPDYLRSRLNDIRTMHLP